MKLIVDKSLRISKSEMPDNLLEAAKKRLTFVNPIWKQRKDAGKPVGEANEFIRAFYETDDEFIMPRCFAYAFILMLQERKLDFEIKDLSATFPAIQAVFTGTLEPAEVRAIYAAIGKDGNAKRSGLFIGDRNALERMLPALIGERRVETLVIVQPVTSLHRWQSVIAKLTNLSPDDIGIIGDGSRQHDRKVIISTIRSLFRFEDELKDRIGMVIFDQCHKFSITHFRILDRFSARYVYGTDANPVGLGPTGRLAEVYLGSRVFDIRLKDKKDDLLGVRGRVKLEIVETQFAYKYAGDWHDMVKALCRDEERNRVIVRHILSFTARGQKAIVLSEIKEHLELFSEELRKGFRESAMIHGALTRNQRETVLESFRRSNGRIQILLSTFHSLPAIDADADVLVVASPKGFDALMYQAVAKLTSGTNEKAVVEFLDDCKILQNSLEGRKKAYMKMGLI